MSNANFLAKIEAARKRLAQNQAQTPVVVKTNNEVQTPETEVSPLITKHQLRIQKWTDKLGFNPFVLDNLVLNEQQSDAVEMFGLEGKSGNLIGPAGTGKTTTLKAILRAALAVGRIPTLPHNFAHKHVKASLGIWLGSYTRIATNNVKANMPEDLHGNVCTLHKLLEFEPVFYEIMTDQGPRKTMRFEPARCRHYPLPEEMCMFVFDEASMIDLPLHRYLEDAIPRKSDCQFLYVGDLAQLPPVFGEAILGFKLLSLPTVELTEVYRHAGRIVNLANHIRIGKTIPGGAEVLKWAGNPQKMPAAKAEEYFKEWNGSEDGSTVTLHPWKLRLKGDDGNYRAMQNLGNFFNKERKEGRYVPESDIILIPYNKAVNKRGEIVVGAIELNKAIANHLDMESERDVYEIRAGRELHYYAVGDKVFFQREEAEIVEIKKNPVYSGANVKAHGSYLNRWGTAKDTKKMEANVSMLDEDYDGFDDIAHILNVAANPDEESKHAGSHIIGIRKFGDPTVYRISKAAEINELMLGYALTIHKSQGSQWRKVYCVFHNSHNRNLQRELLYTAITRAQKELYVLCEPETFIIGVQSQHIKGNTLAQKAEYFKGKAKQIAANESAQAKLLEQNQSETDEDAEE